MRDIPPQYGPGFGVKEAEPYAAVIEGAAGAWQQFWCFWQRQGSRRSHGRDAARDAGSGSQGQFLARGCRPREARADRRPRDAQGRVAQHYSESLM